ncbi:MAG: 50S ribosomal protein L33 [Candidatus Shikimatogenerans sp. AspAUS03]|uniref:Large ribosomal subunit protein bL33 n=1 Tax=Candidatus Shikimatogenerans sp. AspAUS03 TaxID=3158563 RepID=A0AAU7QSQ8_9FLAO
MNKKKNRKNIILECNEQKKTKIKGISRYYTTKNKKNKRIILKKYNPFLRKRTIHKEI